MRKGYFDAVRYSQLKIEREYELIVATSTRFQSRELLVLTTKADTLFTNLHSVLKDAEVVMEKAKNLSKIIGCVDWATKGTLTGTIKPNNGLKVLRKKDSRLKLLTVS